MTLYPLLITLSRFQFHNAPTLTKFSLFGRNLAVVEPVIALLSLLPRLRDVSIGCGDNVDLDVPAMRKFIESRVNANGEGAQSALESLVLSGCSEDGKLWIRSRVGKLHVGLWKLVHIYSFLHS